MPTGEDVHQLVLVPLTRTSWRLCDRALASSDAGSVIAYVELRGARRYEVAWVAARLGIQRYPSLEAVLRAAFELLSGETHTLGRARLPITLVPAEPAV